MNNENWKCFCFKKGEKEDLDKAIKVMIPYITNCNLADRFGINLPNEKELSSCTEIWFLNPNESFLVDLQKKGIQLSKCCPKDNQGNTTII